MGKMLVSEKEIEIIVLQEQWKLLRVGEAFVKEHGFFLWHRYHQ